MDADFIRHSYIEKRDDMSGEFDVIRQYFSRPTQHTELGVGDDAALLQVAKGCQLVVSADMSVAGTHFFENANSYMGATPKWATLAIALPTVDQAWLADFAKGLFACAQQFNVDLIGGDTTRGPLNVAIQIMGEVPMGKALKRSGAKRQDDIWVSGVIGQAALGLSILQDKLVLEESEQAVCLRALHHPEPRVALGLALRDIANSCIDISDGLLADLGHLIKASNVGASVYLEDVPCLNRQVSQPDGVPHHALSGGEDYELCFTAPSAAREEIAQMTSTLNLPLTRIGMITDGAEVTLLQHQQPITIQEKGFDHFA